MISVLELICIVTFFFLLLYEFFYSVFKPPDPPQTLPSVHTTSAFEDQYGHIHSPIAKPERAITRSLPYSTEHMFISSLPDLKLHIRDGELECMPGLKAFEGTGLGFGRKLDGAGVRFGMESTGAPKLPPMWLPAAAPSTGVAAAQQWPISRPYTLHAITTKKDSPSMPKARWGRTTECTIRDHRTKDARRARFAGDDRVYEWTGQRTDALMEGEGCAPALAPLCVPASSPSGFAHVLGKDGKECKNKGGMSRNNQPLSQVMTDTKNQQQLEEPGSSVLSAGDVHASLDYDSSDEETTFTSSSTVQPETDTTDTSIGSCVDADESGFLNLGGKPTDLQQDGTQIEHDQNEMEDVSEESLADMVAQMPTPHNINLWELMHSACIRLSKPRCCAITLLGCGRVNIVFLLKFIDHTDLAACIPLCPPDLFNAAAKKSEIATMYFVRECGLYPSIPVPKIYAWDLTYTNAVGAPFVFMEAIHGRQISDTVKVVDGCVLTGLDALDTDEQMIVTQSLANLHADLKVPLRQFDQIGCITRRKAAEGNYTVGPLYSISGRKLGGPFKSLHEYWITSVKDQVKMAIDDWHARKTEDLARQAEEPEGSPRDFSACLHFLSVLIPWFIPPASQQYLVLSHPDLALRNIIFDSNDFGKIVGVLDWAGASVVPLVLTGAYPSDLFTREDDLPFALAPSHESLEGPWHGVPFDWTFHGLIEKATWPDNISPLGSAIVRRYYLRQHFASYFAIKCDHDITRASLFHDASYYLKFHEFLSGGWQSWLRHRDWISDTYWRIKWKVAGYDGTPIIVGPNVYRQPVEREPLILDLGKVNTSADRFTPYTKL